MQNAASPRSFRSFSHKAQDAAKAIRQAVYSFYNPTMCLEVAIFNRLRLLFPQLNMGVHNDVLSDRFPAIRLHSLCPGTDAASDPVCLSVARQAHLQPALCRGYWPQQQPVRAEVRSHRSSGCVLRPAFPGQ